MCMDAAMERHFKRLEDHASVDRVAFASLGQQVAQLENLLKQHEDLSQLRGNELCSLLALAPTPPDVWTGTVRLPWFGLVTITLRPCIERTWTPPPSRTQAVVE